MTRRTALGLAGVAAAQVVVACSTPPEPATSTATDPDASIRQVQAAAEDQLIAAYDSALSLGPEPAVAALLTTVRDQHIAHRDALLPDSPTPPSPTASSAPGTAQAVGIAGLIELERAAARERRAACVQATATDLTRLLAFICASEASHATALAAER